MTVHTSRYSWNHAQVNKVRGPAKDQPCLHCGRPAQDWATLAGLDSETDVLDPRTGFIALCRKCHRSYDQSMPDWTGKHHTPETIEKLSQMRRGRRLTPEHRENIGKGLKGVERSPEYREKLRKAQAGRKASEETRAVISAAQLRRFEIERGGNPRPHGTQSEYRHGCRCELCRKAHALAARVTKRNREAREREAAAEQAAAEGRLF